MPNLRKRKPKPAGLLALALGFALLAPLLLALTGFPSPDARPKAQEGVLQLREGELARNGPLRLNGDWTLYEGRLLTGAEPDRSAAGGESLAHVPGVWTRYGMPGKGIATYRLQVRTADATEPLGLQVPAIAPAYRILVDGREIASAGSFGPDGTEPVSAYRPQTAYFTPESPSFDLYLQISNDLYPEGGVWYSLTLGAERDMLARSERSSFADMAVFGGCALLGLYQIAVYLLRRSDRSTLYFGICCLLGGVRQWVVGGIHLVQVYPEADIRLIIVLEYLTYYGGVTAAALFVRSLYPREFNRLAINALVLAGFVFIGSVLLLPVESFTAWLGAYKLLSLIALLYFLYGFALACWRGREGALLQLAGWLAFVAAAVHDILYSAGWMLGIDVQLVPYGFVLLVFIEALELARRFTSAYRTIGTMKDELIAVGRLKDEFLANTSHELKTPLHGILNLSQSMADGKLGPLAAAQREQLETIVAVSRRMSNLINDILDLSLLKNNGIALQLKPVDLRAALSSQEEVFRHYIGGKPVSLRMEWPDSLPDALADESRLLQIAYNLIGNAIKFTPEGEVVVSARAEGGMLRLTVADTGIGIPEEAQERIFLSFEQHGTAVAKEYGGAGLGLSITRRLVELHGGVVTVTSKVNEGSVFTVTLPAAPASGAAARPHGAVPGDRSRPTAGSARDGFPAARSRSAGSERGVIREPQRAAKGWPTILAVDDDPVNLQVLQSVFLDEPYGIVVATGGEEALELLRNAEEPFGLVVLDVMMPGLSGYETCLCIRETYTLAELPILLTTVRSEPEELVYGFAAGANDFLAKPFHPYELRARAHTLLEMRRSAEEAVRSESAFLQAQIKPHFLYNTLNTIISLSLDEPRTTHDLLLHLSRYLRGSFDFNNKQKLVPLRKELELAEAYLQIEQARFGSRLRVRYEIEEGVDGLLPPTSLQPLVENAVRHGVIRKEEGGTVTITVRGEESRTVIAVADDGAGMDISLQALLATEAEGESGVGLRNIHQRLLRAYGEGLCIDSGIGGTVVTIAIPRHIDHERGQSA